MAHFIGYLRGTRGEASRLGGKDHGIQTRVQGWQSGVKVIGRHIDSKDRFEIYQTSGSDSASREKLIAVVNQDENGEPVLQLADSNPVLVALEYLLECMGACQLAPGVLERAVERNNINEAVTKARKVISENSPEKVVAKA
jgi:hypothetical protein